MTNYTFPLPGGGIQIIPAKNKEEALARHKETIRRYNKRQESNIGKVHWGAWKDAKSEDKKHKGDQKTGLGSVVEDSEDE